MHSATSTIWGTNSCNTLTIARSLRLSALGSVINAKSSSVSSSSWASNWKMLDIASAFPATTKLDGAIDILPRDLKQRRRRVQGRGQAPPLQYTNLGI